MSTEKKYTERDLILAKREGYAIATAKAYAHNYDPERCRGVCADAKREADAKFPLPSRTKSRRVQSPTTGVWYRVKDGVLQRSTVLSSSGWADLARLDIEDLELVTALLASPMETVEDPADA